MTMNPYNLARSFLNLFDPETAHRIAIKFLQTNLTGSNSAADDPILTQTLWGLSGVANVVREMRKLKWINRIAPGAIIALGPIRDGVRFFFLLLLSAIN